MRPVSLDRFVRETGIIVCYLEDLVYQSVFRKSVFKIRYRNMMQTPALILYSIGLDVLLLPHHILPIFVCL